MSQEQVLHITTRQAWDARDATAGYQPPSLAAEGFIHASVRSQTLSTATRYYSAVQDELVLLVLNSETLGEALRMEPAIPMSPALEGILFPHIYRALLDADVSDVLAFRRNDAGVFELPSGLAA